MKILVSAYACEPNRGSEPGVGWQWVLELSKHHKVWVITRKNNREKITKYFEMNDANKDNLNFIYVDLSKKITFWKRANRGIRLYYYLWQKKAYKEAKKYHKKIKFDLIHHITFVSYTQITFMYKLNIPFVFGPVAGGENIPKVVNLPKQFKDIIYEFIRKVSQKMYVFSFTIRKTFKNANIILTATEETKEKLPSKYYYKTHIFQAIGMNNIYQIKNVDKNSNKVKILMVGRLIPLKGFDIGIKAFKEVLKEFSNAELTILGNGPLKEKLKNLSGKYYNRQICFVENVQHGDMINFYSKFDILVNTSLRDSGCMVILEAMSVGIPVVCIDTGGPKVLTSDDCAIKVKPTNYEKLIIDVKDGILKLVADKKLRTEMGTNARERVKNNFLFSEKYKVMREYYKEAIRNFNIRRKK